MSSALITDYVVGLHNKSTTEAEMIKHLKKCGKSNGYAYFSLIIDKKYLKHIKKNYRLRNFTDEEIEEWWWYKNAVMVFPPDATYHLSPASHKSKSK